jgi:hypothetical protein
MDQDLDLIRSLYEALGSFVGKDDWKETWQGDVYEQAAKRLALPCPYKMVN